MFEKYGKKIKDAKVITGNVASITKAQVSKTQFSIDYFYVRLNFFIVCLFVIFLDSKSKGEIFKKPSPWYVKSWQRWFSWQYDYVRIFVPRYRITA